MILTLEWDALLIARILAKAVTYYACLAAIGTVLFRVLHKAAAHEQKRFLCTWLRMSAVVALAATASAWALDVQWLFGDLMAVLQDRAMLAVSLQSDFGNAVLIRALGLLLLLWPGWNRTGHLIQFGGALLVLFSFTLVGHTVKEPRYLMGAGILIHLAALAYWIGGLAPIFRAPRIMGAQQGGRLVEGFGRNAVIAVGAAVVTGSLLIWGITGRFLLPTTSAYENFLVLKLLAFSGVMLLAGLNKLVLTPRLVEGQSKAARSLRISIVFEASIIAFVLFAIAAATTVGWP
ncbi:copper resistance D family protein [Indioceanicola profundi]|uniref:copper resistance D family protein n=1 Tax=Indioceanicola profundi TaxID=2220096 RepID=UPI001CEC2205|nr:CopD family protein [Indioceanicola profundi]